jgi:hypothetical protein
MMEICKPLYKLQLPNNIIASDNWAVNKTEGNALISASDVVGGLAVRAG